jgi:hypothetical protein
MIALRPLLSCILAVVLLVSAVAAGAARGQTRVAGQIVICSGAGVVTLWVDADGQPVPHQSACPDCVMTALAAVWAGPAGPVVPLHALRAEPRARADAADLSARRVMPPARGPPARA